MTNNSCHRCGSVNLVADRALAGRIICANCGYPTSSFPLKKNISFFKIKRNTKNIIIFIALFMLVVILII